MNVVVFILIVVVVVATLWERVEDVFSEPATISTAPLEPETSVGVREPETVVKLTVWGEELPGEPSQFPSALDDALDIEGRVVVSPGPGSFVTTVNKFTVTLIMEPESVGLSVEFAFRHIDESSYLYKRVCPSA